MRKINIYPERVHEYCTGSCHGPRDSKPCTHVHYESLGLIARERNKIECASNFGMARPRFSQKWWKKWLNLLVASLCVQNDSHLELSTPKRNQLPHSNNKIGHKDEQGKLAYYVDAPN